MKLSVLTGLLILGSVASYGQITVQACTGPGTSIALTGITAVPAVQQLCGDKIFSNFTGTLPEASNILIQEISATNYKLSLTPVDGGFQSGFSFGFTVSVAPGFNFAISQIQDQMLTTSVPNGGTVNVTHTPGGAVALNALAFNNQTGGVNLNTTSDVISMTWNPTGNAGTPGILTEMTFTITQAATSQVPEPGTMAMLGSGLIGLGVLSRRRYNRK